MKTVNDIVLPKYIENMAAEYGTCGISMGQLVENIEKLNLPCWEEALMIKKAVDVAYQAGLDYEEWIESQIEMHYNTD